MVYFFVGGIMRFMRKILDVLNMDNWRKERAEHLEKLSVQNAETEDAIEKKNQKPKMQRKDI